MIDLRNGDCLELMDDIKDKSIDMILCDLPYGVTACKWDIKIPLDKLWEQYNRIIKDNGCIALFGTEPFSSYLRLSNIKNFKYDWIWDKINGKGHLLVKHRPLKQHEIISIFGSGKRINYYPVMIDRPKDKIKKYPAKKYLSHSEIYNNSSYLKNIYSTYYPKTILQYYAPNNKIRLHPTQKPVLLLKYLIKTYTLENENVLDNCMGSGSTGIACLHTKRNFIGIELDNNYFIIAKDRIENEQKIINITL
jgi:site-specific DNA-methyltransferase (adenine-specific)